MARDFARVQDFFMQLQDLQPPVTNYHQYELPQSNPSATPAYELTTGDGGGCADALTTLLTANASQPSLPHTTHAAHSRKRKGHHSYDMSSGGSTPRKRKHSTYGASSSYDDDGAEDSATSSTLPDKKQNHSEIEKRRRDKMNTYITELSSMIPMCGAMARKLDKLTVLRMAVQHLRSVRGTLSACPLTARPRPAFLSERELNALVLQAAHDCFLLVVGCNRGRLLYVSTSVKRMLQYDQSDLLGQSLFDILHPKDVAKVKEQLSSSDLSPRERLIDIKTMLPVKADVVTGASRLCPGSRRSFSCRIKCKSSAEQITGHPVKEESEPSNKLRKKQSSEKKYCVVQCTGYLKSWDTDDSGGGASEGVEDGDACNLSCLVAVGRAIPDMMALSVNRPLSPPKRPLQYMSRHATDGKFLFVDQRNPWTKDVECLVANNTLVTEAHAPQHQNPTQPSYDISIQKSDVEMETLIDSQLESHKIGSAIAEEALRRSSSEFSPDLPAELLQDVVFNQPVSLVDLLGTESAEYNNQVRNNVPLSSAGGASSPPAAQAEEHLNPGTPPPPSPSLPSLGLDGNGEATMAVIMSLLEADAGLGGPVNFSGLPWPLP